VGLSWHYTARVNVLCFFPVLDKAEIVLCVSTYGVKVE
jgi:hypothetical protein